MASVPTRRRVAAAPPQVLIASARQVRKGEETARSRHGLPRQQRALFYYDAIGEVRYAWHFYPRMLMPLRIYPATMVKGEPQEIDAGTPVDLLDRIQDPGGGRKMIAKNYGRLQFGTGEGFLLGTKIGSNDPEQWSFVWREELRFDDDGQVTHRVKEHGADTDSQSYKILEKPPLEELPTNSAVAYRMWTPHPRYSFWPDAPMLGVLDIAEELLLLTAAVMATARARIVKSPIVTMPSELSPGSLDPEDYPEDDELNDPLLEKIIEHIEGITDDPTDPSALAPFLMWGSGEFLDKIRAIWLHKPESDYAEQAMRQECLGRFGTGLDLPPEVIKGLIEGSHWSSWAVTEDMWSSHGRGIADQYVADIGMAYLRPALKDANYKDWQNVVVAYDASGVKINPDRAKDAQQAWDRGAIGYKTLRTATNFKEGDAQTPEEHAEWLSIKARTPGTVSDVRDPNRNIKAGEDPAQKGAPPGSPGPVSERTNLPEAAALLLGAAQMGVLRCRERAGARLRALRSSCPECFEQYANLANGELAAAMSPDDLERISAPAAAQLVEGGADWFQDTLRGWGYPREDVDALGKSLEAFAARTLRDTKVPEVPVGLATLARRAA